MQSRRPGSGRTCVGISSDPCVAGPRRQTESIARRCSTRPGDARHDRATTHSPGNTETENGAGRRNSSPCGTRPAPITTLSIRRRLLLAQSPRHRARSPQAIAPDSALYGCIVARTGATIAPHPRRRCVLPSVPRGGCAGFERSAQSLSPMARARSSLFSLFHAVVMILCELPAELGERVGVILEHGELFTSSLPRRLPPLSASNSRTRPFPRGNLQRAPAAL